MLNKHITVLLIEDNPAYAELLEEDFAEVDEPIFQLTHVESLNDAKSLIQTNHYDVILLDLSLPDSFGLDTLSALNDQMPDAPIIIMTAHDNEATAVQALALGAHDYLVKGEINGSALIRAIRYALGRHQLQKQEKELVQMKDEFIANITHQLRTPLTSIIGFLDLILDNKVEEPAVQREFLTRAAQDADRLLNLVNGLLNVSKLESGNLLGEHVELNLGKFLEETVQFLQGIASEKDIALSFEPLPKPAFIQGDPVWLQQAVVNLIHNAIKFSEPHRPVKVFGKVSKRNVMVQVFDRGPGIPEAELPKLFSRFYQIESSAKRAGTGSGLGLYIARGIIEAHGGKIDVKSKPGQGSMFYFTLPLLQAKENSLSRFSTERVK